MIISIIFYQLVIVACFTVRGSHLGLRECDCDGAVILVIIFIIITIIMIMIIHIIVIIIITFIIIIIIIIILIIIIIIIIITIIVEMMLIIIIQNFDIRGSEWFCMKMLKEQQQQFIPLYVLSHTLYLLIPITVACLLSQLVI